ncbi:MAG: hypothetical protein QOC96_712 [Acidobacteriota bacterium]|nr:hypothetical protein [Acidobacteriota bacterium]
MLERERAQLGAFISLKPATRDMMKEAISAGFYESEFYGNFPKIQILTIEELLAGRKLLYPEAGAATHKRAQRQTKARTEQHGLFHPPQPAPQQSRLPGRDFSTTPLLDDSDDDASA